MNDNKPSYKEKLAEVIGPLLERLFEIERCDISNFIAKPSGDSYISPIRSVCFRMPPLECISAVNNAIDDVMSLQEQLPEIFTRVKEKFDRRSISPFEDEEKQIQKNEMEFNTLCSDITSELQIYRESLEQLSSRLSQNANEEVIPDSSKIQFNLSVEELGVFMRVLKDADIIPKTTTNRSLAESIVDHMTTKRGGARSIKKLEDCLSSKELKVWEIIRDKIAEMDRICHQRIKEIKA